MLKHMLSITNCSMFVIRIYNLDTSKNFSFCYIDFPHSKSVYFHKKKNNNSRGGRLGTHGTQTYVHILADQNDIELSTLTWGKRTLILNCLWKLPALTQTRPTASSYSPFIPPPPMNVTAPKKFYWKGALSSYNES